MDTRQLDDTIIDEGRNEQEDETTKLEEGPWIPKLTIRRIRGDEVDDNADDPNDSSTDSLEDSTVDGAEGISDEHTIAIVEENCATEEKNGDDQILVGSKADERIDGVLERVMTHGRVIVSGYDVSKRAGDDDHKDSTPDTLETYDLKRRKSEILEKELLGHDLTSLDDLGENDKSNAEHDVASVSVALRLWDEETGSTDDAKSNEACDDTNELMSLDATARKEDA